MGRLRGLSFLSNQIGHVIRKDKPESKGSPSPAPSPAPKAADVSFNRMPPTRENSATSLQNTSSPAPPRPSPASAARRLERPDRPSSRPISMLYQNQQQLPTTDLTSDPTPELEPIFNYLNSQTNKLYYEGYLLRLNDLDTNGRPYTDRKWVECFAQLIGTVLWMWDADSLDQGGPEAESKPTHMNVADATVKMVESLPTRFENSQPLQNVLSVSTAGKNRYLFHFNSLNSLTQWTAAIRLTIFENTLLQESYTGALIAGKGRTLNNIRSILERTRFKYEDWVRVRFSPGTPWQRCWCVISPPDEKVIQKMEKAEKKKSAYGRPKPVVKGDIKFYQTKKTKKAKPLVTITDAYSAYAIYPQSRPLIDQSSLVKVEGQITIHSRLETSTEGFVFVLPEVHPAVTGVEIMLRWLFPVYDAFGLYGRPTRLLADTVSTRSLMFAMPTGKKTAYLDNLDVANLIHTEGSQNWSEQEWRTRLKEATAKRMAAKRDPSRHSSNSGSGSGQRSSFPRAGSSVRFGDNANANRSTDAVFALSQRHSASSAAVGQGQADNSTGYYGNGYGRGTPPSRTSLEKTVPEEVEEPQPYPPAAQIPQYSEMNDGPPPVPAHGSPEVPDKVPLDTVPQDIDVDQLKPNPPPNPVAVPPAFSHRPRDLPQSRPWPPPELKRANSRVSYGTLSQMAEMSRSRETVPTMNSFPIHSESSETPSSGSEQPPASTSFHTPDSMPSARDAQHAANPPPVGMQRPFSPLSPVSPLPDHTDFATRYGPSDNRQVPVSPPRPAVARKPLPQQTQDGETRSNYTASSLGSLRHTVDLEAFNRVTARERSASPPKRPVRSSTDQSSVYDQSSIASPDYASSHKSSVSRQSTASSVAKPRMGVLKVVGEQDPTATPVVIGDTTYRPAQPAQRDSEIPMVDFGPTPAYNPAARRPNTADTLKLLSHSRKESDATIAPNQNYERKPRSSGRITPGAGMENRRSGNWGSEEQRKSLLWQPGLVPDGNSSPGPRISPEQFVQQRAELDRTASPVYAHNRNISQSSMARPRSGDWTAMTRPQTAQQQLPPRPHSRGSTVALNQVDLSGRLSAREQEHVARVTGSSFLNLATQTNKPVINSGLVGAIDARERERKAMKGGVAGHLVQQAIAQRQSHSPPANFPPQGYRQPPPPGSEAPSYFPPPQQMPQQVPPPWGQPAHPAGSPNLYPQAPPPPVHQSPYYYR